MAFLTALALSLIFVTAAGAGDETVVTIPLDQIWAFDMPGTRSMDELHPDREKAPHRRGSDVRDLRKALAPRQPVKQVSTGFAIISGNAWVNELHMIRRVLRFSRRGNSVPVTEKVGIVFYSNASAYRVELEKVERRDSVVNIRYRLVPYQSSDPSKKMSVDLAVIPLGKLPAGEYRVEMTRSPMEQKYLDAGHKPVSDEQASHFVCHPFTFEVWGLPEPDPGLSEGAIEIPNDQIWATQYCMRGTRDLRSLDWKQIENYRLSIGSLESLWRLDKNRAEPGYVVPGIGQEALVEAHKKLPEGEKPTNVLSVGTEFSIVYFSHPWNSIGLDRIERKGNLIEIGYRYYPSGTGAIGSPYIALIPLGKLPVGEYRVNMIERPPLIDQGIPAVELVWTHLRVCQSFSFSIVDAIEVKSE